MRTPWITRRPAALAIAAAACIALTSCGTVVDSTKLEKDIASTIAEKTAGEVTVASVTCPEDPPAEKGKSFTCAFVLDDESSGEVTAKVLNEDADVQWDVTRPASGQAEQVISSGYEEQVPEAKVAAVECPDTIKAGKGAETICTIELEDGSTGEVTVTVDGTDVRWEVTKDTTVQ